MNDAAVCTMQSGKGFTGRQFPVRMINIRGRSLKNGIVGDVAGTGTGKETGIKKPAALLPSRQWIRGPQDYSENPVSVSFCRGNDLLTQPVLRPSAPSKLPSRGFLFHVSVCPCRR